MKEKGRLSGLDEAQGEQLARILERVRADHDARLVFAARACGRPLGWAGEPPGADLDALASLVASLCAAGARLGALLGEEGVGLLLQKGERDVIQVIAAGEIVLAVRSAEQPPQGLERLRARLRQRKALAELRSFALEHVAGSELGALSEASAGEIDDLLSGLDRPSP